MTNPKVDLDGATLGPQAAGPPTLGTAPPVVAKTPSTRPPDPYLGKTIDGRYIIEAILGEGGMGVVYRASHRVIGKRVAVKVLRDDMAKDGEMTARFLQEARAASAIGNPHIVDVSDFGQLPDGATYFVMEYLDGRSLGSVLSEHKEPWPIPRIVRIARQIAQALGAAHEANIVHRDLKPDNVMLVSRGEDHDFVKILDFGIAKVGSNATTKTKAGAVFGTPHYMSPEQAAGTQVDSRTDIYALGIILYEMAAGRVPFDADNFMGILTQHMYKAPVPIRALVPEVSVSPGLEAIVLKCLSKKPEGRYPTMLELREDLERLERNQLPLAVNEMMDRSGGFNVPADYFRSSKMLVPVPAMPEVAGLPRRSRWPMFAAISALALGVGIGTAVIIARSQTTNAQPSAAPSQSATLVPSSSPTSNVLIPPSAKAAHVKPVVVAVTPAGALVSRDGASLGTSPVALSLADGEEATIVVALDGYKSETVKVTNRLPKIEVALTRTGSPVPSQKGRPIVHPPNTATVPTAEPTAPPATTKAPLNVDPDDPFVKKN